MSFGSKSAKNLAAFAAKKKGAITPAKRPVSTIIQEHYSMILEKSTENA